MSFEMKIFDVFHLQSGQIVFAGSIVGKHRLLKDCKADLFINNQVYQTIKIDGEFIMDVQHPLGHRAISTKDQVDITSDFVKEHDCKLREIADS
jgi:hypothetical protein